MRTLSRHLPPAPVPATNWFATILFVICAVGFMAWLAAGVASVVVSVVPHIPMNLQLFVVFSLIVLPAYIVTFHRQKTSFEKLMAQRAGENICTFRRAFDLREVDPWIVRAVHEEVREVMSIGMGKVDYPIRASDRLVDDLLLEIEDVEDIAETVAARAGYDFTDIQTNPLFGKVFTVGELVMFFTHQRRLRN